MRDSRRRHGNSDPSKHEQLQLPQVINQQPLEDAGALTHARYRFQWEVGARICLGMLTDDQVVAILCEWHEDHIVIYADESLQLVSVKHREPSEGPWTLRALCVDGGVAHLYQRWIGFERTPSCRVTTNAGLRSGVMQAGEFAAACHSRAEVRIRPYAARILRYLGASDLDDVIAFCMGLSIEANVPGRAHITASNIQDLTVPALRALRLDASTPAIPYEAVVSVVERASRDRADRVTPHSIAEVARFETDTARPALIRSRLVTRSAVRAAVLAALIPGGIPLVPVGSPSARSNLVKKLERGGIGPTAIRSAQRLRAIWSELEARYRADLPGSNTEIEDVRTRVMDLVAAAEGQVPRRSPGEPYGQELMTRVRDLVHVYSLGRVPVLPIEDRHLLGLVYQLTDECEVWWSEEFDLEAVS
jgi:hypothetical protein